MNPERLLQAAALYREAIDLDPDARRAFLDRRCGDDSELRREAEFLLRQHELAPPSSWATQTNTAAAGLGSHPTDAIPAMRAATTHAEPDHIGPYKLLHQLGQGGFGVVYLAQQEQPVRRCVALKVIKLGMDTRQVIARFEAERQALALMSHPNVARIFDAGATSQGRPYFVMEYVQGVTLTEYCDKNQLTIRERLELFVPICEAVQHAHQKGIIHRDIKPSNVLVEIVDNRPVPKVIDFGIAKATDQRLTENSVFTEMGQFIGTPAYMSPEQAGANPLDIDTRTDIYSLGVLLYEVLTGTLPFETSGLLRAGLAELQRIIREVEPAKPSNRISSLGKQALPRPSDQTAGTGSAGSGASAESSIHRAAKLRRTEPASLIRQLRGDLDWITMRTIEKDRTRRYATASDLAADIQRHLKNEPVQAGPPGAAYRVRKFVRRNRGAVAALVGFFVLTTGASIALGLMYREQRAARLVAGSERDRAVAAEQKARRLLADSYAQAAGLAMQRGRWKIAGENYQRAVAEGHPDRCQMRLGIVAALNEQADERAAKAELRKVEQEPGHAAVAGPILRWKAEFAISKGKFDSARKLLHAAKEKGIPPADAAYLDGLLSDTLPEVVEKMNEVLRIDPLHHGALMTTAGAYISLARLNLARDSTNQLFRAFPDDPAILVLLTQIMTMQRDPEGLQEIARTARSRWGDQVADAILEMRQFLETATATYASSGKNKSPKLNSLEYLAGLTRVTERVLTISKQAGQDTRGEVPGQPPAFQFAEKLPKAASLNLLGQHKSAAKIFGEIATAAPTAEYHKMWGSALAQTGRFEQAADVFLSGTTKPAVNDASVAACFSGAANCEIRLADPNQQGVLSNGKRVDRLRQALREYAARTSGSPEDAACARWAVRVGESDAAEKLVTSALSQNPRDPVALLVRAELDLERGANGPALVDAVSALKADPKNVLAPKLLIQARDSLNLVGPSKSAIPVDAYLRKHAPAFAESRPANPDAAERSNSGE